LDFNELLDNAPKSLGIFDSLLKARSVLGRHRKVAVSVSGGSDSDIVMDLLELVRPENRELAYVFFDTGMEFAVTKRHLGELEGKYGVSIERRRAKVTVAAACARHGIPFIGKDASEMLCRLQSHGFDWRDGAENATPEKYGRCKSALDWFFDRRPPSASGKPKFSIARYSMLRDFIAETPPGFKISDKCCDYAKKAVAKEFRRDRNPDLIVNGMRRAEGGRRAGSIKTCFTPSCGDEPDNYRPLWFWTDADKAIYKEWRGLSYSDCYEVRGLKRTGCVGCPCNSKAEWEPGIVGQYEPRLVKAARGVFGASYDYRRRYAEYKNDRRNQSSSSSAPSADSSLSSSGGVSAQNRNAFSKSSMVVFMQRSTASMINERYGTNTFTAKI
jgi:3'-phosphoadenosine 5'-phosphosulfate sulfotransferase (PAPS reductase)/FAD synthetase